MLRGRCRYCREKIAVQYPLVELLVAILFVMVYRIFGLSFEGVITSVLICLLVIASFIDLNLMIIPNAINLMIAITGTAYLLFGNRVSLSESIIGFLIGGGILLLIGQLSCWLLKKEGMGGGDIKLSAACGLYLGTIKTIYALMFAVYSAGIVLIIMLILKKIKKNQCVPFGPFLSAGVIAVVLYYEYFHQFFFG
jgi:leader peptidase (prepilin peptidase)/N-methyltransferase